MRPGTTNALTRTAVVEAVRNRRLAQTPLVAAGQALLAAVDDSDQDKNIDAFLRMAASGPAARSRLRALWDETEDALTEALATGKDGPRELAARRLTAAQIMVLVTRRPGGRPPPGWRGMGTSACRPCSG